jgi:hypothetical protein
MAGAHVFRAVQHPELDTLGLVAIRDFLRKRARYLRLVVQNNKAHGVNVCYALLRMRPLSISGQNVLLQFLAEKSIMTNLASEEIDARCGDCV